LAWLLATCSEASVRDGEQAIANATKACELTEWKDWSCIGTLAAAYAEAGNFDQAVKYQKRALSMEGLSEAELAEEERRLGLFQEGTPYRDVRQGVIKGSRG
jgi:tetratricopeptide (TPR) repeat protein